MSQREGNAVVRFRDHWAEQPKGPRLGWCLGFAADRALHQAVTRYQRALQDMNCLDLVPVDALQLTLLNLGPAEDLGNGRIAEIVESGRAALRGVRPLQLTFGTAALVPDGVVLLAEPAAEVVAVRAALSGGLAGSGITASPGPPLLPLARANEAAMTAFVKATLGFLDAMPTRIVVGEVVLARFDGRYRSDDWTAVARIPLG